MKPRIKEEYVKIDELTWQPFPEPFSTGGILWKLLHVSPELGSWTAIFTCPKGSSFAPHIHLGPGEYLLTKGKMDIRGGEDDGSTAEALSYGYEACNAHHQYTHFPEESEFYMTFLGALEFIDENKAPIAVIGWEDAQALWAEQTGQK